MNKFNTQIHMEEIDTYQPTQADWAEYNTWCESQEAAEQEEFQLSTPEGYDEDADDSIGELDTVELEEFEWTEEAIAWEEGMRWDNLYDDDEEEDFACVSDNELYDYDSAWEEYCDE